jgi:hypothetical protein
MSFKYLQQPYLQLSQTGSIHNIPQYMNEKEAVVHPNNNYFFQ